MSMPTDQHLSLVATLRHHLIAVRASQGSKIHIASQITQIDHNDEEDDGAPASLILWVNYPGPAPEGKQYRITITEDFNDD